MTPRDSNGLPPGFSSYPSPRGPPKKFEFDGVAHLALALSVIALACSWFLAVPAVVVGGIALPISSRRGRYEALVAIAAAGLSVAIPVTSAIWEQRVAAQERRAQAEDLERQRKIDAEHRELLRAELRVRAKADTDQVLAALPDVERAVRARQTDKAKELLRAIDTLIEPYLTNGLDGEEPIREAATRVRALATATEVLESISVAKARIASGDVLSADDILAGLEGRMKAMDSGMPDAANAKGITTTISGLRKKIQGKVAKRKDDIAYDKMEAALVQKFTETCGPAPSLQWSDRGLDAVDRALRRVAHDPSSVNSSDCTPPALTGNCWTTTCSYRAKNAYGHLVLDQDTFYIVGGEVFDL